MTAQKKGIEKYFHIYQTRYNLQEWIDQAVKIVPNQPDTYPPRIWEFMDYLNWINLYSLDSSYIGNDWSMEKDLHKFVEFLDRIGLKTRNPFKDEEYDDIFV